MTSRDTAMITKLNPEVEMRPIQMVDTQTQYQKLKNEIDFAIKEVIDSSAFINGKIVQEFAINLAKYLDVKHVIPCANGTDALQVAMMALGLRPGDEVITPSFTYIATTEVIALLRLTPVFVEVDRETFCIDPNSIRNAITAKTKAIVPVHLYGQSANMDEIMDIAREFNLHVIEDNAQAIGAEHIFNNGIKKKTGTIGTVGTTSFYPSKNLAAFGDGGALYTNDDDLASLLKMTVNHGQSKRYYHDIVGCNSRLDSIQAAVLNEKLKHLDDYIQARRRAADFYDKAFADCPNIKTPVRASYSNHVFHQYTIVVENVNRGELHKFLAEKKIPSMIYYPVPSHRQKMFSHFNTASTSMPVTDWLCERVLSLPMHTELDEEQLNYISYNVLEFANR